MSDLIKKLSDSSSSLLTKTAKCSSPCLNAITLYLAPKFTKIRQYFENRLRRLTEILGILALLSAVGFIFWYSTTSEFTEDVKNWANHPKKVTWVTKLCYCLLISVSWIATMIGLWLTQTIIRISKDRINADVDDVPKAEKLFYRVLLWFLRFVAAVGVPVFSAVIGSHFSSKGSIKVAIFAVVGLLFVLGAYRDPEDFGLTDAWGGVILSQAYTNDYTTGDIFLFSFFLALRKPVVMLIKMLKKYEKTHPQLSIGDNVNPPNPDDPQAQAQVQMPGDNPPNPNEPQAQVQMPGDNPPNPNDPQAQVQMPGDNPPNPNDPQAQVQMPGDNPPNPNDPQAQVQMPGDNPPNPNDPQAQVQMPGDNPQAQGP